jgi:hypothetical protein
MGLHSREQVHLGPILLQHTALVLVLLLALAVL